MKRIIIIVTCLLLYSCGQMDKLIPSFGYNKDNQSTSSSDTLSQSIGYASVSATLGENQSKSYNKSNITSNDLNNEMELAQNTSETNFGGSHVDNSKKKIISNTNKDNEETFYRSSANQIIYNRMTLFELLCILCFMAFVAGVITYSAYHVGFITGKLKNKMNNIKNKYNNCKKNNEV